MSRSLNMVQLIGHLTRDPELKQTSSGRAVANFGIATNSSWKDSSGQMQEKTEFHNLVAWGRLAEICGQYLKKGGKIYIQGSLQTRDWTGEDGVKRYRTEVVADNMIMLDSKGSMSSVGGGSYQEDRMPSGIGMDAPMAPAAMGSGEGKINVEDLPF